MTISICNCLYCNQSMIEIIRVQRIINAIQNQEVLLRTLDNEFLMRQDSDGR